MGQTGQTNPEQYKAIHADGPALVLAGPGTGKTYVIIQRVLHLIRDLHVKPEEIMVVTYTVKASKELMTRLTNELSAQGIELNLHEMYIGTFHHICRRILKEFREYTGLTRNYMETDQFEQQYMVYRALDEFQAIPGFQKVVPPSYISNVNGQEISFSPWKQSRRICEYVNRLSEELMDPETMVLSENEITRVLGWMMTRYNKLAEDENFLDFTKLQTETYRLLSNQEAVLRKLADRIRYILVDEYQDTNYIQEQLIQLLGRVEKNIFVVGDDDQSIYRFRGATIANIAAFPAQFGKDCEIIHLKTNYRSNADIVLFCMKWMAKRDWFTWERNGHLYRYRKGKIQSLDQSDYPSVVKITSKNGGNTFALRICDLIEKLKEEELITDYNQVACLFDSVKGNESQLLQFALKKKGIPVYAPRSGHFFDRKEVAWFIGTLLSLFPSLYGQMQKDRQMKETEDIEEKYATFLAMAYHMMGEHEELKEWVSETSKEIHKSKALIKQLQSLAYDILSFAPFSEWIDKAGEGESLEARNLSALTRLINRFEYFLEDNHGGGKETLDDVYLFFSQYLRLWFENGVGEYEDEEAYAPEGHVSFLNIHQSKGLEYPVVIVASLNDRPRGSSNLITKIVERETGRHAFEPYEDMKYFDFRRKYYTAFSRAESLLVLAANGAERRSSSEFRKPLDSLPEYDDPSVDLTKFHFREIRANHFKPRFSFTQIALYENCPLKYKLSRIYRFAPIQGRGAFYGILVHETIEDIHRAVKRGETDLLPAVIYSWLMSNYQTLAQTENAWLPREKVNQAFEEVMSYVAYHEGDWSMIKEAEYSLEMVKEDYVIDGTIDLLEDRDGKLNIIDFKTGKKPEEGSPLLRRYMDQLEVYAYLVEKKLNEPVGKLILYFTGDEDPVYEIPSDIEDVEERMEKFDLTARRIMDKDFNHKAETKGKDIPSACRFCEWKSYCWKE